MTTEYLKTKYDELQGQSQSQGQGLNSRRPVPQQAFMEYWQGEILKYRDNK
ncbi:MAG: hypothetical protein WCO48_02595 [Candidatus Taylorbacteria bacterium]